VPITSFGEHNATHADTDSITYSVGACYLP
jgi:hypothetical protein